MATYSVGQRGYTTVVGAGQSMGMVKVCVVVRMLSGQVTVGVAVMPGQGVGVPAMTVVVVTFGGSHWVRQVGVGVETPVLEVGGL